jgi:hypothetical protein
MTALQAGEIAMTANNWPTLFCGDSVDGPMEKTKGLLRNHIVIRVNFLLPHHP